MGRHDNIFLRDTAQTFSFKLPQKRGAQLKIPYRNDLDAHKTKLLQEYKEAERQFEQYTPQQVAAIKYNSGTYIEFSGADNYDLVVKSLENTTQGIKLLNIRDIVSTVDNECHITTKATVFIPQGKEQYFIKKITEYASEKTPKGEPKNKDLVSSIESISNAIKISSFWVGKPSDMPTTKMEWFELWIHYDNEKFEQTLSDAINLLDDIKVVHCSKDEYIRFPERLVLLVYANCSTLLDIVKQGVIVAEIRKPAAPNAFFLDEEINEQSEWATDLLNRTHFTDSGVVVCVLDTGINLSHPLINPYIAQNALSANSTWGVSDNDGHGTNMAGVILYNDLKRYLISSSPVFLNHKIESVKILDSKNPTPPTLYGFITEQSILLPQIANPTNNRIFCMAITDSTSSLNNGQPSSWSGAIDKIIIEQKTLIVLSAGNNDFSNLNSIGYPEICKNKSVEDPAQAWNALTVGAYTIDTQIQPSPLTKNYNALAQVEELSPYSTTSFMWDSQWPIKPEVVCDGGNVAYDGTNTMEGLDELSKLTLDKDISRRLFGSIYATSAATAQCSNLAAQILSYYPTITAESLRALIVHSARWTDAMKEQFGKPDNKTQGRKTLLRTCGYGVPNLQRAIDSFDNSVNMIIEGELQPYEKMTGGVPKMKEMQLHTLPWPNELLQSLENIDVDLRVTLSYFIEPGPGQKGWKNKYRYASCGLRFDIKRPNETLIAFQQRINNAMRDDSYSSDYLDNKWFLGAKNRNVGSIHSDVWTDTAINLAHSNCIAVYPVIGWWRERTNLKKYNSKIQYSLVITLETPKQDIDLYTQITTKIANRVPISIESSVKS